jgi:two-component system, NarL family, nitrate/nitrite response regulator NarP
MPGRSYQAIDTLKYRGAGPEAVIVDLAIADKSPIVVAGLRALLADEQRFNLVCIAADGERFLDAVERFRFDLAIIGWVLPVVHGRDILKALAGRENAPRIIVYTGDEDPGVPQEVLELGGAAFVSKREPPGQLVEVVSAVAAGRMIFPLTAKRALAAHRRADPAACLSRRELQLLGLLGSGKTNAQLARELGVSENTVKFHLRNLFDKLGVKNRAQAVHLHLSSDPGP